MFPWEELPRPHCSVVTGVFRKFTVLFTNCITCMNFICFSNCCERNLPHSSRLHGNRLWLCKLSSEYCPSCSLTGKHGKCGNQLHCDVFCMGHNRRLFQVSSRCVVILTCVLIMLCGIFLQTTALIYEIPFPVAAGLYMVLDCKCGLYQMIRRCNFKCLFFFLQRCFWHPACPSFSSSRSTARAIWSSSESSSTSASSLKKFSPTRLGMASV